MLGDWAEGDEVVSVEHSNVFSVDTDRSVLLGTRATDSCEIFDVARDPSTGSDICDDEIESARVSAFAWSVVTCNSVTHISVAGEA